MCNFFEECEFTYEQISEKRARKIRASVLSRIKEERIMKKTTVLRSVMLAATVAAIGAVSLVGSADSVPISEMTASENDAVITGEMNAADVSEEENGFDKVATFVNGFDEAVTYMIGADSNGTVVDVNVDGDVINIEPGLIFLDGEMYMSEAVPDSDYSYKVRVLTEDELGDLQTVDIETIDNGNGYFYYKWHSKS